MKTVDKLNTLFLHQVEFQDHLLGHSEYYLNIDYIKEMSLALVVETGEAIQNLNWKSWQLNKQHDWGKFQDEVVDMWHFLINITLASGMTSDDLFLKFLEKSQINNIRQEEGY